MNAPVSARPPSLILFRVTILLVILTGLALRILPTATVTGAGFDEELYRAYVHEMEQRGAVNYDQAVYAYLARQSRPNAEAELPPTRFLYILSGYLWKEIFHSDAPPDSASWARDPILRSLRGVSTLFSSLTMLLAGAMAWRMAGRAAGLSVLALVACSPLQIHMSQHAMIDGFLAFWAMLALWGLWESLRHPQDRRWLLPYGLGLFCMVLTKENSFFVFCALVGLLLVSRGAKWGVATRSLWAVTVVAPGAALLVLILICGRLSNFIETYRLLVTNAQNLTYAIRTGDGPWYRYLVDLMVLNPVILCLAIAGAFRTSRKDHWAPFMLAFVCFTYLIMCNVRYGMNLRYATIWDFSLSLLAFAQLRSSSQLAGAWAKSLLPALVALVCLHELHQYHVFFRQVGLYELAPQGLLRAVKILK